MTVMIAAIEPKHLRLINDLNSNLNATLDKLDIYIGDGSVINFRNYSMKRNDNTQRKNNSSLTNAVSLHVFRSYINEYVFTHTQRNDKNRFCKSETTRRRVPRQQILIFQKKKTNF